MTKSITAVSYFSKISRTYLKSPWNPLWRSLKAKETQSFLCHIRGSSYSSALDIACGQGHYTNLLAQHKIPTIYAFDAACGMGSQLQVLAGVNFQTASLETYKPPQTFDLMVMMGCWEFLDKPYEQLEKILNWMPPRGEFIFSVPKAGVLNRLYKFYYSLKGIYLNAETHTNVLNWCQRHGLKVTLQEGSSLSAVLKVYR